MLCPLSQPDVLLPPLLTKLNTNGQFNGPVWKLHQFKRPSQTPEPNPIYPFLVMNHPHN